MEYVARRNVGFCPSRPNMNFVPPSTFPVRGSYGDVTMYHLGWEEDYQWAPLAQPMVRPMRLEDIGEPRARAQGPKRRQRGCRGGKRRH